MNEGRNRIAMKSMKEGKVKVRRGEDEEEN